MIPRYFKNCDYVLLIVIISLALFGLMMVYSSSMIVATGSKYQGESDLFFNKQAMWMLLALCSMSFFMLVPYQVLNKTKVLFYGIVLLGAALLSLKAFGSVRNNANSWLEIGIMTIQPSEFAKIGIIIYLASVISKKQAYINHLKHSIIPLFVPTLAIIALIFFQPDAGTAFIISIVVGIMILCSGISGKNVLKFMTLGIGGFVGAMLLLSDTQNSRISAVLDPFADVAGTTYQLVNGFQAISLGGFFGLGFGKSIQKYGYLPEAHTDFILAIISEELGFFGVFFVLACLFTIIARALVVARECRSNFGSLVALGIASLIFVQTFVNVGGLLGLIPLTGVTLPLVSYGGSSLLSLSVPLGILLNISAQVKMDKQGLKYIKVDEKFKKKGNVTYLET